MPRQRRLRTQVPKREGRGGDIASSQGDPPRHKVLVGQPREAVQAPPRAPLPPFLRPVAADIYSEEFVA